MADTQGMVSAAALIATAASFWGAAAPGIAEENCPDGVRYNVKSITQFRPDETDTPGSENHAAAETELGSCVITFRAGWRLMQTDREACATVIHEVGHAALGLDHDAGGIMQQANSGRRPPGICFRYSNRERSMLPWTVARQHIYDGRWS